MRLHDAHIMHRWHVLLDGCRGYAPGILDGVEAELTRVNAPDVSWSYESLSTGLLKACAGKRRDFLLVRCEMFPEHVVCIGARDFGTALGVAWFLAVSPRIRRSIRRVFHSSRDLGSELDVFDMIDLQNFVTVTRSALQRSVQHLLREQNRHLEQLDASWGGLTTTRSQTSCGRLSTFDDGPTEPLPLDEPG